MKLKNKILNINEKNGDRKSFGLGKNVFRKMSYFDFLVEVIELVLLKEGKSLSEVKVES